MPTRKRKRIRKEHDDIVKAFAVRLRELRTERGRSRAALARAANVHWTYVSRLEEAAAAPGIDLLAKLAIALEVPVADLLPTQPTTKSSGLDVRARTLFDQVLHRADPAMLGTLNAMLNLMVDKLSRGARRVSKRLA